MPVNADGAVESSFTTGDFLPPSPITNLSAVSITSFSVKLLWISPGDDGNIGTATGYDIRWSVSPITTESKWINSNKITKGIPAPAPSGANQTCIVTGLLPSTTYYFAMKTVDDYPNWSGLSNCASITTPAESQPTTTPAQPVQPTQTVVVPLSPQDEGPIRLDFKGKRAVIFLDLLPDGTLARSYIITLNDRQLEMTIQKGTIFLDNSGKPLNVIILEYVTPYVSPPPGFELQDSYNFQPYCVIEPSIEIKILYKLKASQADVNESDINIASYNQNQSFWMALSTERDITAHATWTNISHFGLFSLLMPASQAIAGSSNATQASQLNINDLTLSSNVIEPGNTLTVNFKATNVGGTDGEFDLPLMFDGETLDSKKVLLRAQEEKAESFTVVVNDEGIHTVGVGSTLTTVTVRKALVTPAGSSPPFRDILLWASIIGLAIVCIIVLINLWRKDRAFSRR